MKQHIDRFVAYLRYERNASPNTIREYRRDVTQFMQFLTPPGEKTMPLAHVDHRVIREFVGWSYDQKLEKSSVARKLAALRTFFKFCVREGVVKQNPARLVSTPKLPKRVPRVLTAEEMNGFLDNILGGSSAASKHKRRAKPRKKQDDAKIMLKRDRAILELLYASGLRVSELVGLDLGDIDRAGQMLRVLGKGRKERVVPFGSSAQAALEAYWPVRDELLNRPGTEPEIQAVFLNHYALPPQHPLRPHNCEKILAPRRRQLGPSSPLAPPRLRHALARGWRRPARDSGTARPRLALHHTALYASQHSATHECV